MLAEKKMNWHLSGSGESQKGEVESRWDRQKRKGIPERIP